MNEVITQAKSLLPSFAIDQIVGIGVDTTASSPMPVDSRGTPLCFLPEFKDKLNAFVWLWKDHTSYAEAELITDLARKVRPQYIEKCGNSYSSEWFWSKILHLRNLDPETFNAAFSFVEHCDWIPAVLTGNTDPLLLKRSVCAAGHKAMFSEEWGGLPDLDFLAMLDPALAAVRARLFAAAHTSDTLAGMLCPEWATRLGLKPGAACAPRPGAPACSNRSVAYLHSAPTLKAQPPDMIPGGPPGGRAPAPSRGPFAASIAECRARPRGLRGNAGGSEGPGGGGGGQVRRWRSGASTRTWGRWGAGWAPGRWSRSWAPAPATSWSPPPPAGPRRRCRGCAGWWRGRCCRGTTASRPGRAPSATSCCGCGPPPPPAPPGHLGGVCGRRPARGLRPGHIVAEGAAPLAAPPRGCVVAWWAPPGARCG